MNERMKRRGVPRSLLLRHLALGLAGVLVLAGCGGGDDAGDDPTGPAGQGTTAAPTDANSTRGETGAPAASGWDGVTDADPGTVTLAGTVFTMETVTHCQETFQAEDRSGVIHKIQARGEGLRIDFDYQTPTDGIGVPRLAVSITPSDDPAVIIDLIGQPGVFAPEGFPEGVPTGGRIAGSSSQDGIDFSWDVGVPAITPVDDTPGFDC